MIRDKFINPEVDHKRFRLHPLVSASDDIGKLVDYDEVAVGQQIVDSMDTISQDEYLPTEWCLSCYRYYLQHLRDYAIVSLYTNEVGY